MRSALNIKNLDYGFTNFDNFFYAMWLVFEIITLKNWSNVMYKVCCHVPAACNRVSSGQNLESALWCYCQFQDVYSAWAIPTIYFITLVMWGANFLLKLMLAVIWDRFSTVQAQLVVDKEAAEVALEAAAVRLPYCRVVGPLVHV